MYEDCPEFLKPRLRLFLSADIVGSTALKQSRLRAFSGSDSPGKGTWFPVIQGFYIEARQLFLAEWARVSGDVGGNVDLIGEPPRLWKTIGDEVLFVKVLSDYRQLAVALNCWKVAAAGMREFLKGHDPRLDVKCTAWVAGFPIKDAEVVLDNASYSGAIEVEDYFKESGKILNEYYVNGYSENVSVDFIGPSIDIGFRLSQYATSRKFSLSVDIPFILSLVNPQDDGILNEIQIFYGGSVPLKGVFGGVNYPLFWMNMSPAGALSDFEDKLTNASPVPREDLRKYCEAFYKEHSAYTFRPFIAAQGEQQIVRKPDWYDEAHSNMVKNFLNAASDEPQTTDEPGVDAAGIVGDIEADVEGIASKISLASAEVLVGEDLLGGTHPQTEKGA